METVPLIVHRKVQRQIQVQILLTNDMRNLMTGDSKLQGIGLHSQYNENDLFSLGFILPLHIQSYSDSIQSFSCMIFDWPYISVQREFSPEHVVIFPLLTYSY